MMSLIVCTEFGIPVGEAFTMLRTFCVICSIAKSPVQQSRDCSVAIGVVVVEVCDEM